MNSSENRDIWPGGTYVPDPPWPDGEGPKVEGVTAVGNLVEVLETRNEWALCRTFCIKDAPPDPAIVNPRTTPWLYARLTAIDEEGNLSLTFGREAWIPLLSPTGSGWLPLEALEFVEKPTVMEATKMTTTRKPPAGKGLYLWICRRLIERQGATPAAYKDYNESAAHLADLGIDWVRVKMTQASGTYNELDGHLPRLVNALDRRGIEVHGWGYVYPVDLPGQARVIGAQARKYGLASFDVDAEEEWKPVIRTTGIGKWKKTTTTTFHNEAAALMSLVRAELPADCALGFTSYRFPTYHPIPWVQFTREADYHAPQVYWEGSANAAEQLRRSLAELKAIRDIPFSPIGAAYTERGWQPTPGQMDEYEAAARAAGCESLSWWEWWQAWFIGVLPVIGRHPGRRPETGETETAPEAPASDNQIALDDEWNAALDAAAEAALNLKR